MMYSLAFLRNGSLPWFHPSDPTEDLTIEEIVDLKHNCRAEDLFAEWPGEFIFLYNYI